MHRKSHSLAQFAVNQQIQIEPTLNYSYVLDESQDNAEPNTDTNETNTYNLLLKNQENLLQQVRKYDLEKRILSEKNRVLMLMNEGLMSEIHQRDELEQKKSK